jgi:hypothetical protein
MKSKKSKNQHKHDDFQDLEAMPSKDNQKQKARYVMLKDGSDHFYYGACPECGKEGQLKNTNADLWSYCAEHKTAWIIQREDDYYGERLAPGLGQSIEDAGYKLVRSIKTRLETPENKVAMLEEMEAISITPTTEIHLVDQNIQIKECFGLHPLPDGCTVQVRFREHLSVRGQIKQLKLIKDQLVDPWAECPFE